MSVSQCNAGIFVGATGIVIVQPRRGAVAFPPSVHASAASSWPTVAPISPWENEVAGLPLDGEPPREEPADLAATVPQTI